MIKNKNNNNNNKSYNNNNHRLLIEVILNEWITRHEIYRLNLNYKVRFHLIIIDLNIIFMFKGEVSLLSGQ